MRGLFVTGTDTGVGKTLVACTVARALRERGIDLGVMKPIETGVGSDGPLDAIALRAAAGAEDALDLVCPQQFALPAAPTVAAAHEGREVDLVMLDAAWAVLAARHDSMLVEGAGGLLVPAAAGVTMADLAERFGLPLLIAARGSLGTINHTLLKRPSSAASRWRAWSSPTPPACSRTRMPPTWPSYALRSASSWWARSRRWRLACSRIRLRSLSTRSRYRLKELYLKRILIRLRVNYRVSKFLDPWSAPPVAEPPPSRPAARSCARPKPRSRSAASPRPASKTWPPGWA
jgi:dethiobiotin synthase